MKLGVVCGWTHSMRGAQMEGSEQKKEGKEGEGGATKAKLGFWYNKGTTSPSPPSLAQPAKKFAHHPSSVENISCISLKGTKQRPFLIPTHSHTTLSHSFPPPPPHLFSPSILPVFSFPLPSHLLAFVYIILTYSKCTPPHRFHTLPPPRWSSRFAASMKL